MATVKEQLKKIAQRAKRGSGLNIGIFTDTFYPDINGVSISVSTLKNQLESLGHNVFVITTSIDSKLTGITYEQGVLRIHGIALKKLYNYRMAMPYSFAAHKYIKAMDLDVIHVHTEFGIGIFARLLAKFRNIPVVYTYHTLWKDYTHYVIKGQKFKKSSDAFVRLVSKAYCNSSSAVIAPTQKTKNILLKYGVKSNIYVIPTGIETENFCRDKVTPELVQEFKEKHQLKNKFTVLFLGRIAHEKSIDMLIDGIGEISKKQKDIKLLIVGSGPSLEDLKAKVEREGLSHAVAFAGKMEYSKVPVAYAASDIFATASLSETQGLTFLEAMASGLCVLARKDDVYEGILKDGENGFYFLNVDSFVQKLLDFYKMTPEQKQKMRENAVTTSINHSAKAFGQKIYQVYKDIIDEKARK